MLSALELELAQQPERLRRVALVAVLPAGLEPLLTQRHGGVVVAAVPSAVPEPDEHTGDAFVITEASVLRQALLIEPLRKVVVAVGLTTPPYGRNAAARTWPGTSPA